MEEYLIRCNKKQIEMIAEALEEQSRMICGQLSVNHIPSLEYAINIENRDKFVYIKNKVNYYLNEITSCIWGDKGNNGIRYDEKSDVLYEMYKQILHTFEKQEKENCLKNNKKYSSNVHSEEPLKLTKIENIKIRIISEREIKLERLNAI